MKARLVVLISGSGTNLAALLRDLPGSGIDAEVVAVGADGQAPGLQHANERGIPTCVVSPGDYESRESWGVALGDEVASYAPDWVVLSGFMKLLPPGFVDRFPGRILNTHPAYLPEFPGAHGVRDALAAGASETGASVIIIDDGVDTGDILARERVPIHPGDTSEVLHERIKVVERALLLDVLRTLIPSPTSTESTPSS
ncbi:phosphoribosylglycinamide formyltransferase [Pontimonas sp.]|nr:phosphoribosylglycinamide formyltransferase [Pontimonas sp.]MDA9116953.1 phosphoribosylglycinamide formyltransferase [Pontimonas sp.]